MFLMWYRRKIAKEVEEKMLYMGSCPNEMEIILSIIAPKDYSRKGTPHCSTDCWNTKCQCYCVNMKGYSMRCPYCESGTNDFVPMNQAVEYSGIEMAVNRQGMLRVRVLDDDGSFTTQDIIEIRNCPLCGKRFMKGRCV